MGLQEIKDTFYAALRDRVAAGNASRTVVVRGVLRPGVVVVENELPGATVDGISLVECFCLRWTDLDVNAAGLVQARCEIRYASDGSSGSAGMDRGRGLAAMDEELRAAVNGSPQSVDGFSVSEAVAGAAVDSPTGTRVFWSDVSFGGVVMRGERLERTASVEVFGYE